MRMQRAVGRKEGLRKASTLRSIPVFQKVCMMEGDVVSRCGEWKKSGSQARLADRGRCECLAEMDATHQVEGAAGAGVVESVVREGDVRRGRRLVKEEGRKPPPPGSRCGDLAEVDAARQLKYLDGWRVSAKTEGNEM